MIIGCTGLMAEGMMLMGLQDWADQAIQPLKAAEYNRDVLRENKMILSASRRTDIPACYSEWFYNRIRAGYVLVRNPMNFHQIGKIRLSPEVVDGIVFWTKNPVPMMERLPELDDYNYYFQFTLTAYGRDVEPNLPSKSKTLIPAFCELSRRIGRERVIWRYDPIFLSSAYTVEYHLDCFRDFSARLAPFTEKCTVSFLDFYKNTGEFEVLTFISQSI